ncbi:MAG: helix-turn-helix transcriptional regulator [Clostridia bacterium]|nr:helix-turn-helix transcriptional regulator [Clostridia bacterium]
MQREQFDLMQRLAKAISVQFGKSCEVVVHDLSAPDHSIAVIENGHVSSRGIGDSASIVALEAMNADRVELHDRLGYLTKTHDGRMLKSSTVYIRDDAGNIDGIFCINFDMTALSVASTVLNDMASTPKADDRPEKIPTSVNELLDDLIEKSVEIVGKPVALMTKDDKIRAIRYLKDAGAFLITRSGDKVSNYFGISKYTLYAYLDL